MGTNEGEKEKLRPQARIFTLEPLFGASECAYQLSQQKQTMRTKKPAVNLE